MAARHPQEHRLEQRYIHLVRLAWDLRCMGVAARMELPEQIEPYLVVRGRRELRVIIVTERGWVFRWGRGRAGRVDVLDAEAARIIFRAAL